MTQGMSAHGVYDRHSDYQMAGGVSHLGLVSAAAKRLAQEVSGDSFFIADYGSAQGRVSNPLIAAATQQIRQVQPDIPIFVCHNDVVTNDWKTLFDRLGAADSYPAMTAGTVVPMASATSFYEPVTPMGQVDLGLSFAAIQWLREPGLPGSGTALYYDQLEPDLRELLAHRAHSDWTRFLSLRADELAPGGVMVLDMMGVDSHGVAAGGRAWRHLSDIAAEMADDGRISSDLLEGYVFPVYERTMDELLRPFYEEVGDRLRLQHSELHAVPDPIGDRYAEDGDAARFAEDSVGFIKAFSEPSLVAALDPDGQAIGEMFELLQDRIEANPDDFEFKVHALTAVVART